jgi:hypothetical protein
LKSRCLGACLTHHKPFTNDENPEHLCNTLSSRDESPKHHCGTFPSPDENPKHHCDNFSSLDETSKPPCDKPSSAKEAFLLVAAGFLFNARAYSHLNY